MKLSNLAIIFLIIVIPIAIALSEYINNKIEIATTELEYNTKLIDATHDAIKAYQINTVNNAFGDVTNSKISDIEDAINVFYNSLINNFNYTGYKSSIMKQYVPAIGFTLYDGYYIYSPFENKLTGIDIDEKDSENNPINYDQYYSKPGEITNGLKPYVYYSVRYVNTGNNWDFVITYTLDNYITIQGIIGQNNYVFDCGYLYSVDKSTGITHKVESGQDVYYFDGVEFKESDTEELKEFVGNQEYSYAKINGKKYYLEENENDILNYNGKNINKKARIFYINTSGQKDYNQTAYDDTKDTEYTKNKEFIKYYLAIKYNKSAYIYYKRAYEFSKAVLGNAVNNYKDKAGKNQTGYNLANLMPNQCEYYDTNTKTEELKKSGITPLSEYGGDFKIFENDMHLADSNFNKHRKAIIRYVIETNMSTAISGFSSNVNKNVRETDRRYIQYIMPKISETDWNIIQNHVCAISFLQGLKMGSKTYNGYSVVANMLTKEYIDENDIYILKSDNTYCKVNDNTLNYSNIKSNSNYYPGIWKINFERLKYTKEDGTEAYYYPTGPGVLGSYTSIMGSYDVNEIGKDMYSYIHDKDDMLKKAYYMALGRERWCSFNINNINYELYGSNGNEFFLQDY